MQNRLEENHDAQNTSHAWQATPASTKKAAQTVLDPLTAYLTDAGRELVGMTEAEKDAVIAETRQHLLASAKAYEELGETPEQALQSALAAYGAAQTVGRGFSTTYQTTGAARKQFPRAAMRRAMRAFATANLLVFVVLVLMTYASVYRQGPFAGVGMDALLPWLYLIIPAVVGGFVGSSPRAPRAWLGTFFALSLMAIGTSPLLLIALFGQADSTPWAGLIAVFPMLFVTWIPVGCLAAGGANAWVQRRARTVLADPKPYQRRARRGI